jgi:uncharacterized protein YdeI (YjbR/CyaY-like superfamily)
VPADDPGPISFRDAAEWEIWLADHHDRAAGVWLKVAKKGSGLASVTTAEALEVALCYGWIDSHRRAFDDQRFLQKYSPRRARSSWSKVNVDKVEALIVVGRMQVAGLDANALAKERFESLGKSDRYAVILRLLKASGPADRAARLRKAVDALTPNGQP